MITFLGTTEYDGEVYLYFSYTKNSQQFLKVVKSVDGFQFSDQAKYVIVTDNKQKEEKKYPWKSFRIVKQRDQYLLTYLSATKSQSPLVAAWSTDLTRFRKLGLIGEITETATMVPDYSYKNHSVMYFGEQKIKIAFSTDFTHWKADDTPILNPRENHFDSNDIEVGNAHVVNNHILLTYYAKHVESKKNALSSRSCTF